MTVQQAVEKCAVLQQAGPCMKEQLALCGVLKQYKKNEFIFREREEVQRVYFIVSGYAVLLRMNCHCDRRIIFICGNGELLNEIILEEPVSPNSAQAFLEAAVLSYPRNQFLAMMERDFSLCKAVFDSGAKKIRRLCHQIANTSSIFLLERRLASKLWKMARDFGEETQEGVWIAFETPATLLADMVGAKRESVSRALKVLREEGILTVKENRFLIPDMDKLQEFVYEKNRNV